MRLSYYITFKFNRCFTGNEFLEKCLLKLTQILDFGRLMTVHSNTSVYKSIWSRSLRSLAIADMTRNVIGNLDMTQNAIGNLETLERCIVTREIDRATFVSLWL